MKIIRRIWCAFFGHDTAYHIKADHLNAKEFTQELLSEPGRGSIVECHRCRQLVIKQEWAARQD